MDESMYDIHVEFELYYNDFLKENNLTKQELEQSKTKQLGTIKILLYLMHINKQEKLEWVFS